MRWYQRMVGDVHQEVSLGKLLQSELVRHCYNNLFGAVLEITRVGGTRVITDLASRGGHISGKDNYAALYALLLQDAEKSVRVGWICESKGSQNLLRVCLLSHGLHSNAPFVGEKDKNLVGWVVVGRREEVELVPTANQ